ncbi:MAG: hypothetical protein ACXABY_08535 [Candidatus Thorarchaeota archaeon]|jgi:hypothetical protein
MATYDGRADAPSASPDASKVFVLRGRADFRKHPCAVGDAIECLTIPAGTILLAGAKKVTRAEGGTLTVDLGISNGGVEFDTAVDVSSTTDYVKMDAAPLTNSDTFYECTAETTVYAQANHAADYGIVDFYMAAILTTDSLIP